MGDSPRNGALMAVSLALRTGRRRCRSMAATLWGPLPGWEEQELPSPAEPGSQTPKGGRGSSRCHRDLHTMSQAPTEGDRGSGPPLFHPEVHAQDCGDLGTARVLEQSWAPRARSWREVISALAA